MSIDDHFEHNVWNPVGIAFLEQAPSRGNRPGQDRTLMTLLLIDTVTRKRCLLLHDDALDTTAHVSVAPLTPSRRLVWGVATNFCFAFLYFLCWSNFLSSGSASICGFGKKGPSVSGATLCVPPTRARPQALPSTRKSAVSGKVHLPCWRFIVVRHGGNVHRGSLVFCSSDESPPTFFHKHVFSRSRWSESSLHTIDRLRHFTSSLVLSSAGVAPLPPCPRKLLDETVKTFAVFPSWLYFLDGEDNCMLSVPLSTSDLHYSR